MEIENHRIELIEGDFFCKGDENAQIFLEALFDSFSLLSWFSQASQINILDEQHLQVGNPKTQKIYKFTSQGITTPKYLVQFEKDSSKGELHYCLLDNVDKNNLASNLQQLKTTLKVTISLRRQESMKQNSANKSQKTKTRNAIFIDINDYKGVMGKIGVKAFENRIDLKKNDLKNNQIEYFYKQPHSRRYKEIPHCHFNLAFQGGGAKAVSYVGVFKALKQLHRGVPITSFIGSSAGGLLAFAICTEMKPEGISQICLRLDTVPKDKYFSCQSEISPQSQKIFDTYIHKIKCLLHNYGILEGSIFNQVLESLSDLETSEKILKVLEIINPSVAQIFSLELKEPVSKKNWFGCEEFYTHRFNYYGLLNAGIMNGIAYQNMAVQVMTDYFGKHFNKNYRKSHPQYECRRDKIIAYLQKWGINSELEEVEIQMALEEAPIIQKIKHITLKEFYQISGVEFTCTAVDLDDKTLRFFNQKTTPDLPICKAVQLSGSFPVAFKSQTWEKHWGKYYIHYQNTRKQIDLTGHLITDGGLLANFPIKYIDNEDMRPMYFSHCKNPCNTILYGFGLDEIQQKKDKDYQKTKQKSITELKDHILSKISKFTLIKNLIFSDSSSTLQEAKIEQIPLFDYLFKLANTMPVSDYNLNLECFKQKIILTDVYPRAFEHSKNKKMELQKFKSFRKTIGDLQRCSLSKKGENPRQLLKQTCINVVQFLKEYQTPQNSMLQQFRSRILSSLYNYQGIRIKHQITQSVQISNIIRKIEDIYPPQLFKMQQTTSVKQNLIKIIIQIEEHFKNITSEELQQAQIVFQKMVEQLLIILDKTDQRISQIIQKLQVKNDKIEADTFNKLSIIDSEMIFDLASLQSKFFIVGQPYIDEIFQQIDKLDIPGIKIQNQIMKNAANIESELRDIIRNNKNDKIHLVLQSKENSHLYFCSLFEIIQDIIHNEQFKQKNIDMITTSDIHSVFAFLLAGGKKVSNIRKQMWKVKDLITFQQGIVQQYETYKWTRTESHQMQQMLNVTWKDHYEVFQQMQKYLYKEGDHELAEKVKVIRAEFMYSKTKVTNSMSQILDYVVRSSYEAMKYKDDPKLQKKRLAEFLSLKNGKYGNDYKIKNKKISKNTQRAIRMLMIHFEQFIVDIILNNVIVKDSFEVGIDEEMAQKVWRGVIIKKILSSKKLELYIKDKLSQMKLNPNTTLSQFYQFCQRKITLNFSVINKNKARMEMLNRYTKPNMPIWAAIIASTSMPFLFPDFNFQDEWQFSPFADSRMRKLVHYFFDSQKKQQFQQSFISGNYVSTLPLELLTNPKLAKQCFVEPKLKQQDYVTRNKFLQTTLASNPVDQNCNDICYCEANQYTVITFAFRKKDGDLNLLKVKPKQKQFLSFSNILNLGMDYMMGKFKNIQVGLKSISNRIQFFKFMSIGIQYHDNTIMNLYYQQTTKLPIILGTLDFYKIESGKSQLLHQCIYQSEFIVRGIFENLCVTEDLEAYQYEAKKKTYLQYQRKQDKIYLKFISKSKWNRKLATMYKISWRYDNLSQYNPYNEEQIVIPKSCKNIIVKFDYPDTVELKVKSHQLQLNFQNLRHIDEAVFFKFDYQELDKRYLLPVPLFSRRLNTRVIPHSKTILSEPKITDSAVKLYLEPKMVKISERQHTVLEQQVSEFSLKRKNKKLASLGKKIAAIKQNSKDSQEQSQNDNPVSIAYLLVKTKVTFKNDGLFCKGCVKSLSRTGTINQNVQKSDSIEIGQCSKCKKQEVIIGYKCYNKKCDQKNQNSFCFSCLFVYLVEMRDGVCRCKQKNHKLTFTTPETSKQIVLCHFCSTAATSYYQDSKCNINMCLKCSLILEIKTSS